MKKLELLKAGIEIIISFGVGAIVGNAVTATTPGTIKGLSKLSVKLGSFVLAGIASDMAATYTEKKIDETVETVRQIITTEDFDVEK